MNKGHKLVVPSLPHQFFSFLNLSLYHPPPSTQATGMRISTIVQSIVTMAVAITIGFIYGWKLALLIFGCLPVLAISGALEMKILQGGHEKDAALIEEAGKVRTRP